MLVYGDHWETAGPRERLHTISARLARVAAMPPGIDRHAKLVGVLIDAGQVQQGGADEGADDRPLGEFVLSLARGAVRSWDSGFADLGDLPLVSEAELPARVQ